jgi:hypothetical protein
VSARIALQKQMMPCSNFFFGHYFSQGGGREVEKKFSGHSNKVSGHKPVKLGVKKIFSVKIPVITCVKPLFLDQYL